MLNDIMTCGLAVLFLGATHGYASDQAESAEAYVAELLEARVQQREAAALRQSHEREQELAADLARARSREVAALVDDILADIDSRPLDLERGTGFSFSAGTDTSASAFVSLGAFQDEPVPEEDDDFDAQGGLVSEADKTGTNPINFQFDARLYNEYQWLNVAGDGGQNITTFEFRAPFADGDWQLRVKVRANYLDIDRAGIDEFGLGDTDLRLLTVPIVIPEKRFAIALGAEFYLPTASDDVLGRDAFTVGPQLFFAFFGYFGLDLIAPGYQHQFSVWEESGASDVHLGAFDLFLLKTFNDKQQWVLVNAQGFLNYENQREWAQLDLEVGTMLDQWIEASGHSIYIRPSVATGGDRPYDYSIEAGYKIVW